jgi:hypothetical protein
MKKKALAALCLAGLTVTQICVAGGNSNWSGSDKYQPPKEDTTVTDTTLLRLPRRGSQTR